MLLARQASRNILCQSYHSYQKGFPRLFTQYLPLQNRRFSHIKTMDTERQSDLISFWFNRDPKDWFVSPAGLDEEIRAKYQDLIVEARSGALDHWAKEPKGVLCLVILLDQFPRNIFRGSAESFSSDLKAQSMVLQAIAQQFDKKLGETSVYQQSMLYLPLMHAEDLLSQIACEALLESLCKSCPDGSDEKAYMNNSTAFTRRHLECVVQLGRFPKRNEALGRPSTKEEIEYLKEKPTGF